MWEQIHNNDNHRWNDALMSHELRIGYSSMRFAENAFILIIESNESNVNGSSNCISTMLENQKAAT